MTTFLRPPEKLDLDNADIGYLNVWLAAFDDYKSLCTNFTDDASILKLFLTVAGLPVRQLVDSFDPKPTTYAEVVNALKNYIQPIKSIVMERHKFFTAKQLEAESVTQYLTRLKQLAASCDFSNVTVDTVSNQLIRDQFLIGVSNKKITEALLQAGDVKLAEAVKKATSVEQAEKDLQNLAACNTPTGSSVMAVASTDKKTDISKSKLRCYSCNNYGHIAKDCRSKTKTSAKPNKIICSHCKKPGHNFENCFARATCASCGKTGHTSKVCKNKPSVLTVFDGKCGLRYISGTIFGKEVSFLVDPGASLSLINFDFVNRYGLNDRVVSHETKDAVLVDGGNISLNSAIFANINVANISIEAKFFVSKITVDALLGLDILSRLNFSMYIGEDRICAVLPTFLSEYDDIFDKNLKESCLQNFEPFEIIKTPDEKPMRSFVRQFNKIEANFLRDKVAELQEAGVIEISHSPWRASPVVVPKSDGSKRLTINYKPVNSQTIFDSFPLPNVEELLSKLSGAKVFSKIDFAQFYHQIPLVNSDRSKTAFFADGQLWQYTRMPFGLKNAVAACSRIMAHIFKDINNVLIYLDDILIFAPTQVEHDTALKAVLDKIRYHGLSLNRKKCEFNLCNVNFLGFFIENGQIRPDPSRLSPLIEFPLPNDLRSLERFLGMTTYFSKFIQHYSDLAEPLMAIKNHLLRVGSRASNTPIDFWPDEAKKSFDAIKSEIVNAVLVLPRPEEPLVLRTDASDFAIGAVLQTESGQPVSFISRVLNEAERNYDIVEKEALAVFWSITRSKMFLLGRQFTVVSDHKPLQFLFSTEKVSAKVLRWRMALQEYSFKIIHCKGEDNVTADCLSRINFVDFAPPTVSLEYVQRAQSFDNECKFMLKFLNAEIKQKPEEITSALWSIRGQLIQKSGIIYHKNDTIFVPKSARIKVLTLCHGLHRGIAATHASLREACFWPGDKKAVEDFVNNCRICSIVRPKYFPKPNEPLMTKSPMEILAMDYIGPLPDSGGNRYILTVIDIFSKYAFAFPVKDMSAVTLIEKCKEVFSLVGFPNCVLTDRGTQFLSDMFLEFLGKFNIKKLSTNSYSPHSNGCCERFNGSLQKKIFAYLKDQGLTKFQWIKSLPGVLLDYRTTVHSTTGCRPVDLFFSYKVVGVSPAGERERYNSNENIKKALPLMQKMSHRNQMATCSSHRPGLPVPGDEVLVKFPITSKFKDKGQLGRVEKVINSHTVKVLLKETNTWVNVNPNRLSSVKQGAIFQNETISTHSCDDNAEPDNEENDFIGVPLIQQTDAVRASRRQRKPPHRFGIDDAPIFNA